MSALYPMASNGIQHVGIDGGVSELSYETAGRLGGWCGRTGRDGYRLGVEFSANQDERRIVPRSASGVIAALAGCLHVATTPAFGVCISTK